MPTPSNALVTVTAVRFGLKLSVNTAVVAVPVVFVFTKFTVPLTVVPVGALTGKLAKLVLMSAALAATLNVAVLFSGLVSFNAFEVPVPVTPVEVCRKLIEALTVPLGVTLTGVGAARKLTTPVAVL